MAQLESLRLIDFSDRELLLLLNDVADNDGWGTSVEVASKLNLNVEHPNRHVSSRFSWLVRFGALEREHLSDEYGNLLFTRGGRPKYGQRWRLTTAGRTLALGKLTSAERARLEGLSADRLLVYTRGLTRRYRTAGDAAGALMGREWRYGTHPLRALNGALERD
jgi:hypothetical protein